jgi:hypothetical protein
MSAASILGFYRWYGSTLNGQHARPSLERLCRPTSVSLHDKSRENRVVFNRTIELRAENKLPARSKTLEKTR